jgi:site-specific DNA recombinase
MSFNSSLPICRGYIRVSTNLQSEDGASLQTQIKRIQDYCSFKKLNLTKIYEDRGLSAKNIEGRPGLKQLLDDIQKGEYVLVTDLSRLARNTKDALNMFDFFKEKGAFFVCLNPDIDFSTGFGELMFTIISAINKLERQNISANVKANLQRLSAQDKLRSRAPFGHKFVSKDRDMESDEEQQKVIEKIREMHIKGMNLTQIAGKLNQDGDNKCLNNNKKTKTGECFFQPTTVKRILVDNGVIVGDAKSFQNRKNVNQRIISHHKNEEIQVPPFNNSDNIIRNSNPGSGPILEIVP